MKKILLLPLLLVFCFLGYAQKKSEPTKTKQVVYLFDAITAEKMVSAEKLDIKKVAYKSNLFRYFKSLKNSPKEFLVLVNADGKAVMGMTINEGIIPISQGSASENCGISCDPYIEGCENVGCFLDAQTCLCECWCVDDDVIEGNLSVPDKEGIGN